MNPGNTRGRSFIILILLTLIACSVVAAMPPRKLTDQETANLKSEDYATRTKQFKALADSPGSDLSSVKTQFRDHFKKSSEQLLGSSESRGDIVDGINFVEQNRDLVGKYLRDIQEGGKKPISDRVDQILLSAYMMSQAKNWKGAAGVQTIDINLLDGPSVKADIGKTGKILSIETTDKKTKLDFEDISKLPTWSRIRGTTGGPSSFEVTTPDGTVAIIKGHVAIGKTDYSFSPQHTITNQLGFILKDKTASIEVGDSNKPDFIGNDELGFSHQFTAKSKEFNPLYFRDEATLGADGKPNSNSWSVINSPEPVKLTPGRAIFDGPHGYLMTREHIDGKLHDLYFQPRSGPKNPIHPEISWGGGESRENTAFAIDSLSKPREIRGFEGKIYASEVSRRTDDYSEPASIPLTLNALGKPQLSYEGGNPYAEVGMVSSEVFGKDFRIKGFDGKSEWSFTKGAVTSSACHYSPSCNLVQVATLSGAPPGNIKDVMERKQQRSRILQSVVTDEPGIPTVPQNIAQAILNEAKPVPTFHAWGIKQAHAKSSDGKDLVVSLTPEAIAQFKQTAVSTPRVSIGDLVSNQAALTASFAKDITLAQKALAENLQKKYGGGIKFAIAHLAGVRSGPSLSWMGGLPSWLNNRALQFHIGQLSNNKILIAVDASDVTGGKINVPTGGIVLDNGPAERQFAAMILAASKKLPSR